MSRLRIALAPLALAAALLAGCGSSGAGGADPATITPGSALAYVSLAVRPPGGAHGDAASDLRRLTRLEDPLGRLAEALLRAGGVHAQLARIEPWMGERVALFVSASPPVGARRAVVADMSDVSRARSFLAAIGRAQRATAVAYRGVRLQLAPGGLAEGIVRGFVVIGSATAVREVVDTALGAAPLSRAEGYSPPLGGALADAYLSADRLADALAGATASATAGTAANPTTGATAGGGAHGMDGGEAGSTGPLVSAGELDALAAFSGARSVSLVLTARSNALVLQGRVRGGDLRQPAGDGGAQQLASLPAGSWLAAGKADLSASAPRLLALLRAAAASRRVERGLDSLGAGSLRRLLAVLAAPGTRLESVFAPWAAGAGVFVSGTGLLDLRAALLVDSSDPAATRAAVERLASIMRRAGAAVRSSSIAGTDAAVSVRLQGVPAVLYIASGRSGGGAGSGGGPYAGGGGSGGGGGGSGGGPYAGASSGPSIKSGRGSGGGGSRLVIGLGQASVQAALRPSGALRSSPAYASATAALGGGFKPSVIVEFPALLGMLEATGLTQSASLARIAPYLRSLGTLSAGLRSEPGAVRLRAVLSLAGG